MKPSPNSQYTVVAGDTLWDIARTAYGDPTMYELIWDTNRDNLRSDDPHWIYPGEILWLPDDADSPRPQPPEKNDGDPAKSTSKQGDPSEPASVLRIGGHVVPTTSMVWLETVDTPANGWTASVRAPARKSDAYLLSLFKPYGYQPCDLRLDGKSVGDTLLYGVNPTVSGSRFITLSGFTKTVDLLDCNPERTTSEKNIKLSEWIRKLCRPFGINVVYDAEKDPELKKVCIKRTEKVGGNIKKLITERGLFWNNTRKSELYIGDAIKDRKPVAQFATIKDPKELGHDELQVVPVNPSGAAFDGRKVFRRTKVYSKQAIKDVDKPDTDSQDQAQAAVESGDLTAAEQAIDAMQDRFGDDGDLVTGDFFEVCTAIAQKPPKKPLNYKGVNFTYTLTDVMSSRLQTFDLKNTGDDSIEQAAEKKAKDSLANSMTFTFPVKSWYTPEGKRWEAGQVVEYRNEFAFFPDPQLFVIRSIRFFTGGQKRECEVTIVPTWVYDLGMPAWEATL